MKPSPLPVPQVPPDDSPDRSRLSDPRFRNLLLGGAAALIALVLLAASISMAGFVVGLVGLGAALISLSLAWLLWKIGLPTQPGGVFTTGALILCGALVLPLIVGIGMQTTQTEWIRPVDRRSADALPVLVKPASTPTPAATGLPLLQDAYPVARPGPNDSSVEVTKDSKIKIDDQYYRINAGETFIFQRYDGNDVVFQVGNFLVSLPSTAVKVGRPETSSAEALPPQVAKEDSAPKPDGQPRGPLESTRAAQAAAIKRYPALSVQDSRENRTYVEAYLKLKESNPDFFNDPEWPLQLAEGVAEREGWKREDK